MKHSVSLRKIEDGEAVWGAGCAAGLARRAEKLITLINYKT